MLLTADLTGVPVLVLGAPDDARRARRRYKAAGAADQKTKGKYSKHIGTGRSKAKEALDKLDGKKDGDVR